MLMSVRNMNVIMVARVKTKKEAGVVHVLKAFRNIGGTPPVSLVKVKSGSLISYFKFWC